MLKKALFICLLSFCTASYAKDSLSIQNSASKTATLQTLGNNIKYVAFKHLDYKEVLLSQEEKLELLVPVHVSGEYFQGKWNSNWFVNLSGGVSLFVGSPLGCEDMFGRIRPLFHASAGKWFSSTVGGRVTFQGLDLKSHLIERQKYVHIHADFLWNATNQFRGYKPNVRWNLIPFAGTGIAYNQNTHQHSFTLNYGLINSYRVYDRISLSLEIGSFTSLANFDGVGKINKFGDHLFHVSAGISMTLGKRGWKRVVDIQPYVNQNNHLLVANRELYERNKRLRQEKAKSSRTIDQLRRIIEVEGLLERYCKELDKINIGISLDSISTSNMNFLFPKNDYSGLNSLRERLQELNPPLSIFDGSLSNGDSLLNKHHPIMQYASQMTKQKECIGSPILFFFKIRTVSLTDSSQLANLDEISRLCKKYGLMLRVAGYADSATGSAAENTELSQGRAQYITSELEKRGIASNAVVQEGKGGVDMYSPDAINRCVKVEIHLPYHSSCNNGLKLEADGI